MDKHGHAESIFPGKGSEPPLAFCTSTREDTYGMTPLVTLKQKAIPIIMSAQPGIEIALE